MSSFVPVIQAVEHASGGRPGRDGSTFNSQKDVFDCDVRDDSNDSNKVCEVLFAAVSIVTRSLIIQLNN